MTTPRPDTHPIRRAFIALWLALVAVAFATYFFRRDLVLSWITAALEGSPTAAVAFVLIGTFRVFTLVPATVLIIAAIPFFKPWTLVWLMLLCIATSSSICYFFAEVLHLDEGFRRKYPKQIARLTETLQKWELPIIIGWSFMLFLPTDVLCYVCGALRINFPKFLLGVLIGEGTVYAIYIFAADYAMGRLTGF